MTAKDLANYTHTTKYSNYRPEDKRRETKRESGNRMMDMHVENYAHLGADVVKAIEEARTAFHDGLVLGSQRALQYGGTPIMRKNARAYNCTVSYCDRPRFFAEAFWLLLCGCGTGFSVQKHHVAKLPDIAKPILPEDTYVIPDTIEGWADALSVLLSSYFVEDGVFPGYGRAPIVFDYSLIRPEGSKLSSTTSGKAPGPEPLKESLEKIRELLDRCIENEQTRLRPIDCYDIVMHASDAVLSGGVRRSASICIFSADDDEMAKAKVGAWFTENPQRGRSNNSALLLRKDTSFESFKEMIEFTKQWGEPGFYWADSTEFIPNPCFDPNTRIATERGMMKIVDMVDQELAVVTDSRVGKGDDLNDGFGTKVRSAHPTQLTQKSARVYTLTTSHGHKITATENHIFPTSNGRKELKDLEAGDQLFLPSGEGVFGEGGDIDTGFLLGLVAGDGTFAKGSEAFVDLWSDDFESLDHIGGLVADAAESVPAAIDKEYARLSWMDQGENKKRIGGVRFHHWMKSVMEEEPETVKTKVPECVWRGSRDMVRGYIQGLIFADGSVNVGGHGKKQTVSTRLHQSNEPLLREVQTLLAGFGIVSSINLRREEGERTLPDGKGGLKDYFCKAAYDLIINRPNCVSFEEKIGVPGHKGRMLSKVLDARGRDCRKPERFITRVVSVEFDRVTDVYCLTQPETNTVVANGVVTGQCVEIGMMPVDSETGLTGWQMCNLSTINVEAVKTREEALKAARAAAIMGTLQAGYTSFEYLGEVSERITAEEALLGVSMTGMWRNPDMAFDEDLLNEMANVVLETNEWLAGLLGINVAARATCLKPEGTGSLTLETSSGMTPDHSRRYFRMTQANHNEEPAKFFEAMNPDAVEISTWNRSGKDKLLTFCIEAPEGAIVKDDVDGVSMLQRVKLVKEAWVDQGKRPDLCRHEDLSHNVSNTIHVKHGEWEDVTKYIYENRNIFAGVALTSSFLDLDIRQAPNTRVREHSEIVSEYGEGALFASSLVESGKKLFDNDIWIACDTVQGCPAGYGVDLSSPTENVSLRAMQEEWVEEVQAFSRRHFEGDVRRACYCLKDVYLLSRWNMLQDRWVPVDYTQMIEEENNVKLGETVACAGGVCELPAEFFNRA